MANFLLNPAARNRIQQQMGAQHSPTPSATNATRAPERQPATATAAKATATVTVEPVPVAGASGQAQAHAQVGTGVVPVPVTVTVPVPVALGQSSTGGVHSGGLYSKTHTLHTGEQAVHTQLSLPRQLQSSMRHVINDDLPEPLSCLFEEIGYFAMSTTDEAGRPWATLVALDPTCTSRDGVTVAKGCSLEVSCSLSPHDGFVNAMTLGGGGLFAVLGIDFADRRRVKVQGFITKASVEHSRDVTGAEEATVCPISLQQGLHCWLWLSLPAFGCTASVAVVAPGCVAARVSSWP